MAAWMIMTILGLSLSFAILDDSTGIETDDTPDEPDTPDVPVVPGETVNGTAGNDALQTTTNEILNGLEGNDTLTAGPTSNGAVLNGGAGADILEATGANSTLNGGEGQDSLLLDGPFNSFETPDTSIVNGGNGDDTIQAGGLGGIVNGGGGDDVINGFGMLEVVDGGNGDDIITHNSQDYGGGTPINGGAGNDRITVIDAAGVNIQSLVDGGAGNDTINSSVFDFRSLTSETNDVLTGGAGQDVFQITFASGAADPSAGATLGSIVEITDFNAAEDQLVVDLSTFPVFATQIDDTNQISFDIVDRADGSGSDVNFTIGNADADGPLTGSIALTGVTGLQPDDITLLFSGT